ncbi:MAG: Tm-1-like ATP-binding domain-containing protein [Alphaproteobacteria bacterium]
MSNDPNILIIGTVDTKSDELLFMKTCIEAGGGRAMLMDVGVLGHPSVPPDITKHDVAAAAGTTIADIVALGDENKAMTRMADGASRLTRQRYVSGRIDGMIALGGTMGTDLALDAAAALPLGVPKMVVSTVAFSPLIPAERMPADLMMILWAGGLYGLNGICKSALSQAAGAVLGACRSAVKPREDRPVVGMTSLGKSCLSYMVALKPELEARGYEVAVFHTTGMGGRAFESLAAQGRFAAVMDFSLPEVGNHLNGSVVSAGADRLEAAGAAGIPQIVAPGCIDLVDLATWAPMPDRYKDRGYHAHNRLIASVALTPDERRRTARAIAEKLAKANGPTTFILPLRGIEEWDREGEPVHDPAGLSAFIDEIGTAIAPPVRLVECDGHINDAAFATTALGIFDDWVRDGIVPPGGPRPKDAD